MLVEREVRDQPFQPAVILVQLAQPLEFAHDGLLRHAVLAAQIADWAVRLGLLGDVDHRTYPQDRPLELSPFSQKTQIDEAVKFTDEQIV